MAKMKVEITTITTVYKYWLREKYTENDSNLFVFPIIISLLIRNSFSAHLLLLMCGMYCVVCINMIVVFCQDPEYPKLAWFYQNKIVFCIFFNFNFQSTLFSKNMSNFSHCHIISVQKIQDFPENPFIFLLKIKLILGLPGLGEKIKIILICISVTKICFD